MKILSVTQIREADAYTIEHDPIASIDLMELASRAFVEWFCENFKKRNQAIKIFCGLGDNGGDGLAIARMLHLLGYDLEVFVVRFSEKKSENFQINLGRLQSQIDIQVVDNEEFIFNFDENNLIIDAIFGSGISRPLEGLVKTIVEKLNRSEAQIIAVDMPSGLMADKSNNATDIIIKATHTVSFQLPKLAFMLPQNAEFVGDWHVVDIGLHQEFIQNAETKYFFSTPYEVEKLIKPRKKFSHKGTFGHGLLVAGSYGMMGAAVLSARGCMRSGVGKLTVHSIPAGLQIMQMLLPEAMYWEAWGGKTESFISTQFNTEDLAGQYQAVGIGPGLGVHGKIRESIEKLCEVCAKINVPMVLDADALNNFSTGKGRDSINKIPKNSILTPHPKEFQKLINKTWKNDFEKLGFLIQFAVNQQVIVCLKGANTAVALPDGTIHFNSSGNVGMATAGSGDVLTGMILALLAQGYTPKDAAILGVYQHGLAGDKAAEKFGMTSMMASDIVENIRF
jgi:ADP-dependent NAD(P)H-hydrate dehydratase / NAD(P)H-hydrate epimerase